MRFAEYIRYSTMPKDLSITTEKQYIQNIEEILSQQDLDFDLKPNDDDTVTFNVNLNDYNVLLDVKRKAQPYSINIELM